MPRLKSVVGKVPSLVHLEPKCSQEGRPSKTLSEGPAFVSHGPIRQPIAAGYEGARPYNRGTLDRALQLARTDAPACAEQLIIEADAPSARASRCSLLRTWQNLSKGAGFDDPFLLTPQLIYTVTGVLKAAEYRSAANYLCAAKRAHIEAGHPWSPLLDHCVSKAIRSARRALGPSRQAEALPLQLLAQHQEANSLTNGGPVFPGRASLLASWWLLREIEASHARVGHIKVVHSTQTIEWTLPNSKTDLMALGTTRAHSCACSAMPPTLCPFHVMTTHLSAIHGGKGKTEDFLFPTEDGSQTTKEGWASTFVGLAKLNELPLTNSNGVSRYSGHTARASGAQHLARHGIELWRIQLFGRWTSQAFLRYVREAPLSNLNSLATEVSLQEAIRQAKATIAQAPALPIAPASSEMLEEGLPEPTAAAPTTRHTYVLNLAPGGKVHRVLIHGDSFHPRHWRAHCNWFFGRGLTQYDFVQLESGMRRCRSCFSPVDYPPAPDSRSSSTSSSSRA